MKAFFLSICAIFTIASCNQANSGDNELLNREWHLEVFEEVAGLPASAHQIPQDEHYILVLSDTAATGISNCNKFQGDYKLDGKRISITNIAATEMDCGNSVLEATFLNALRTAKTYSLKNGTLKIQYSKDKQLVFQQERR